MLYYKRNQIYIFAGIAQLVEQLNRNQKVGGSIPLAGTSLSSNSNFKFEF